MGTRHWKSTGPDPKVSEGPRPRRAGENRDRPGSTGGNFQQVTICLTSLDTVGVGCQYFYNSLFWTRFLHLTSFQ